MRVVRLYFSSSVGGTAVLAERITENCLIDLRETKPAILDMFHERDTLPYRDLLLRSGEFAGKYITGAYFIYRITLDKKLYDDFRSPNAGDYIRYALYTVLRLVSHFHADCGREAYADLKRVYPVGLSR